MAHVWDSGGLKFSFLHVQIFFSWYFRLSSSSFCSMKTLMNERRDISDVPHRRDELIGSNRSIGSLGNLA